MSPKTVTLPWFARYFEMVIIEQSSNAVVKHYFLDLDRY